MKLAVFTDGGESFLFNRGRANFNSLEDAWVQDVDTGVDSVANEFDRFFNKTIDAGGMAFLVNDHTVFGWLFHLGDDDGALLAMVTVELGQLLERIVADDIRIQDEERRIILTKDLLGQFQRASSAERFRFDGEFDLDVVFLLVLGCVSLCSSCSAWIKVERRVTFFKAATMMSGR